MGPAPAYHGVGLGSVQSRSGLTCQMSLAARVFGHQLVNEANYHDGEIVGLDRLPD